MLATMRVSVLCAAVLATCLCVATAGDFDVPARPPFPHPRSDELSTAGRWMSCSATQDGAGNVAATVRESSPEAAAAPETAPWEAKETARAQFNDTISEVGWSYLHLITNPAMSNAAQAYCAGYLEGKITAHRIYQYAINGGANMTLPDKIADFVTESNAWLSRQIEANPKDDYWMMVDVWRRQVVAIQDGFFAGCSGDECDLIKEVVLHINIGASLGNVAAKFNAQGTDPDYHPSIIDGDQGHCTGFVKLLPDNSDLFVGQDTWTSFNSMTRVFKLMDTPFRLSDGSIIPGRRQTFSSYPSSVFSGDDYYTLSSGLVVCETTIGTYNTTSYEFITPETVWEACRNTVANRLATDGESWGATFGRNNNGGYNNQFYVVDTGAWTPGTELPAGTLWVTEQLPGYVQSKDVTDMLKTQGYFGSYNLPLFKETIELSNISAVVKEYGAAGDWFTYRGTSRAKIMDRDHAKVTSVDAMKAFMRYNDFEHDPLSRCDCNPPYTSENAIACRGDLNPANGTYDIPAFKQRNHAATDSKFTTAKMMAAGQRTWAISSPTYDQQPVFVWSTSPYASVSHIGQPDRWEFPWTDVGFGSTTVEEEG